MKVDIKLLITHNNKPILSKGKYFLLKEVEKSGSLNAAAKSMGISYKKAFSYINSMEDELKERVLIRTPGKSSKLAPKGIELIKLYDFFYKEIKEFIDQKMAEYENK